MKRRQGAFRNRNNAAGVSKRALRRVFVAGGIAAGVVLIAAVVVFLARPRMLWYVDEDFSAAWNRVLQQSAPPFSRYEIKSIPAGADTGFPKGRFGYIISRKGPEGERIEGVPVQLFRDLSDSREYGGWLALALDPWMVFRKHQDPEPQRIFLDLRNDRGSLLLPGADGTAVQAWLCQLFQESPGVFSQNRDAWVTGERFLEQNHPFQSGAFTYSWVQVWPVLLREKPAYLYAPLSQARSLQPYRQGLLDATRFPEPANWGRYGMQADILWAGQRGSEKQWKKIAAVDAWLRNSRTQTVIANAVEWIPAHPSGVPYNTVSWETQMAWLRSSFIWQGADDAKDS